MSNMLHSYVHGEDTLARLQEHARRLQQAQRLLHAQLPPFLREYCGVANLRDGVLVVHAQSSAVAVKLRQTVPSLMAALARSGLPVQDIRVKVGISTPPPPPPVVPRRELGENSVAHLTGLMDSLPADDPLRQALARFISRSASPRH